MKTSILFIMILTAVVIGCSPKTSPAKAERIGETVPVNNKDIDWDGYDITSTIPKISIAFKDLQGRWSADKGVYRFGEIINAMELTKPFIVEFKDDRCKRNPTDGFEQYLLKDNLLIISTKGRQDSGIINKLTANELTISWKAGSNYTRYFYKK